jgi:hypothetical protein
LSANVNANFTGWLQVGDIYYYYQRGRAIAQINKAAYNYFYSIRNAPPTLETLKSPSPRNININQGNKQIYSIDRQRINQVRPQRTRTTQINPTNSRPNVPQPQRAPITNPPRNSRLLKPGDPNPPRIIKSYFKNRVEVILAEQKPQIRETEWKFDFRYADDYNLSWLLDGKYHPQKNYYNFSLAFPYIVTLSVIGTTQNNLQVFLFYRNQPLTNLEGILCIPNLFNIFNDCRVCLGTCQDLINDLNQILQRRPKPELITRIRAIKIAQYFWDSKFKPGQGTNAHITAWARMGYQPLTNLSNWQTHSLQNPEFVLNQINWGLKPYCSAQQLLNRF